MRERKKDSCREKAKVPGGFFFFMHRAIELCKKEKTRVSWRCAVKKRICWCLRWRKTQRKMPDAWQKQTEQSYEMSWMCARMVYGHPRQVGALTLTYFCDYCECFPLSDCTLCASTGVCKGLRSTDSNWFCGRCGYIYNWREDSCI